MTTLAHRSALAGPRNGGIAARRAVVRWARRLVRREWRQQLLVLTLLTVSVAAAIGSITIAYNAVPADDGEFGSANALLTFDGSDARKLEAGLDAARRSFGTIDVVGHRSVPVPGGVEAIDYRAQDPDGAYSGDLLALRRGSYPTHPGEVAVTDGVADSLQLQIGSTLALDGRRRTVVGIVENPSKLSDEFALVSRASARSDHVDVLVDASSASIRSFFESLGEPPGALMSSMEQGSAVGGTVAAVLGTIAGLALWVAFAPTLESAVDHRIARLSLPWGLIAMAVVLTVLGATAAAWWPGRAVARLPVILALSGRPPNPRPARHSAVAAMGLIAIGIACLALSNRDRPPLIVAGILATILGTLLLGPLAIRIFALTAGRAPVAARVALRDLARYQARSGAALAAITLALGIAAAVVVTAAAEEKQDADRMAASLPNLSDSQIRVYTGSMRDPDLIPMPLQTPAQLARSAARVRQLAAGLGQATVLPLRKVLQPGERPIVTFEGDRAFVAVGLARQETPRHWTRGSGVYVATPALLGHLGIDPATVAPSADFLADRTVPTDQLIIMDRRARKQLTVTNVQRVESRQVFGSGGGDTGRVPDSFVTLNGLRRHGWKQVPAGWLVESTRPLTSEQIADARDLAAETGLTIETQRERRSLATPMAIATAAGALLALAILAMSVGLIRSESAGDLRTLTATGATSRIRRTLTAATAGALALLGALLGVAGAYVVLTATYQDDLGYLSDVPIQYLALIVVGVPMAASAAGWLLAGREPSAIARPVIE